MRLNIFSTSEQKVIIVLLGLTIVTTGVWVYIYSINQRNLKGIKVVERTALKTEEPSLKPISEETGFPSKSPAIKKESSSPTISTRRKTISTSTSHIHLPININKSTRSELEMLSGIGPKRAADIINYREVNGAFKSIDEIVNVKGIGPKTFLQIRDKITVE